MTRLSIAVSPCPNDTFAVFGLATEAVRPEGVSLSFSYHDIAELNDIVHRGEAEIAKVSISEALRNEDRYRLLPVGAAVGYGVGPLVLKRADGGSLARSSRVLGPGATTTATLLYNHFFKGLGEIRHTLFSEIMPMLRDGEADFGVVIHEGRFTFERYGLVLYQDLGTLWEESMGLPLPLGGLVARRDLSKSAIDSFCKAFGASLQYAESQPAGAFEFMRHYARELDDEAIRKHVELYVSEETKELSPIALRAIDRLRTLGRTA